MRDCVMKKSKVFRSALWRSRVKWMFCEGATFIVMVSVSGCTATAAPRGRRRGGRAQPRQAGRKKERNTKHAPRQTVEHKRTHMRSTHTHTHACARGAAADVWLCGAPPTPLLLCWPWALVPHAAAAACSAGCVVAVPHAAAAACSAGCLVAVPPPVAAAAGCVARRRRCSLCWLCGCGRCAASAAAAAAGCVARRRRCCSAGCVGDVPPAATAAAAGSTMTDDILRGVGFCVLHRPMCVLTQGGKARWCVVGRVWFCSNGAGAVVRVVRDVCRGPAKDTASPQQGTREQRGARGSGSRPRNLGSAS